MNFGKSEDEKREIFEFIRSTINERYDQYFKLSNVDKDSASKLHTLGSVMVQNMLGQEEPVLDPMPASLTMASVVSTMETVANLFNNYEVIDG